MDGLSPFGLFAVSAMLVFYALEHRSRWFMSIAGRGQDADIRGKMDEAIVVARHQVDIDDATIQKMSPIDSEMHRIWA